MASVLVAEQDVADFFESSSDAAPSILPSKIANWLSSDFFGLLNDAGITIDQSKVDPANFAELVTLVETGEINASSGKNVLEQMFRSGNKATSIVKEQGLKQLTDPEEIELIVSQVLEDNPAQAEQYLKGKRTLDQWFFGQVMRATGGRADPSLLRNCLQKALSTLEEQHLNGGGNLSLDT
jgi:aspartyl-tRNA(Asn)/glutamyl-tRNA(Gln) amidotransferase subunit B